MNNKIQDKQILFDFKKTDFEILKQNKIKYSKYIKCDDYIHYLNSANTLAGDNQKKRKIIDNIILL